MENYLLLLPSLLPLALALLLLFSRNKLRPLLLLAPITALAVALAMPLDSNSELPWLLLGVHLQLDETAKLFLLFSSIIWLIAALYILIPGRSQQKKPVYITLFLVAMAGNFLLILAADMLSFYLGFALMGLSAYGLTIAVQLHRFTAVH